LRESWQLAAAPHRSAFERNTSTNGAGGLSIGGIMGGALLNLSGSHFFTNTGG